MAVAVAPKGAFHVHPLWDDDLLGIDPFKVRVAVLFEQFCKPLARLCVHGVLSFPFKRGCSRMPLRFRV